MAFVCDICGKSFCNRRNLTRHMKTHSGGQTYSCSVCVEQFNRLDNRKRHELSHQYNLPCDVCGVLFNRSDALHRHRALHDRPPTKRPASPELSPPGLPSKQRQTDAPTQSPPQSPPQSPNVPIEVELPEDPETRVLYLRHWNSIRDTEITGNVVQDQYNFTLNDVTAMSFPAMVRHIFQQQNTAFRINLSFGFILRHVESGELRYYHPSQNNARFFEVPYLIRTEQDLERFLDELSRQDMLEDIRQQRPDTKWVVHLVTNVTFYINKLNQHSIGANVLLPDFISKNRDLAALLGGSNGTFTDDLCIFRCLAVHKGTPAKDVETPAKIFFHQYLLHRGMSALEFKGVTFNEMFILKKLFEVNVYIYDLQQTEDGNIAVRLVRRSPYKHDSTMNLNLYEKHFSYVTDMDKYSKSYLCSKCDRLWKHTDMLHRHERTCQGEVIYKYPGGVYHTPTSVFDELENEDIDVPEDIKYYPFRATYDIEAMLTPTDKQRSDKVEWTNQHVLLSISVCSNVPDFTDTVCFVSEGDTENVVDGCFRYLTDISSKAFQLLLPKFGNVFTQMTRRMDKDLENIRDPEEKEKEVKKHYLYPLKQKLECHLIELPAVGFNSGKYDINAMTIDFFARLVNSHKIKYTIKRNNTFMCVKTENLKFLDITKYLAPGFSYSQFLKAYGCEEEKGFFCYEHLTSLDKLDATPELPPHDAFFLLKKRKYFCRRLLVLSRNMEHKWYEDSP